MHRDIKFENILVHDEVIKIADFGLSIVGKDTAQSIVGTFETMSYEILKNVYSPNSASYNSKIDLWSIGIVYYEMLLGYKPFYSFKPTLLV